MRRGWKRTVAVLSILGLAGCVGFKYNEVKDAKPKGSAFDQALFKEYLAESKSEYTQANYTSSDRWASGRRHGGERADAQTDAGERLATCRPPSSRK